MKDRYGRLFGLPKYLVIGGIIALPLGIFGQNNFLMLMSAFLVIAIALILGMLNLRKTIRLEIQRFEQRQRTTDLEFLREMAISPTSDIAQVVLTVREVIAEYAGGISSDCITAQFKIPNDFGLLFDSLDVIDFIMAFEHRLGIRIPDEETAKLWPNPQKADDWTIKNFALVILNLYEKQHSG